MPPKMGGDSCVAEGRAKNGTLPQPMQTINLRIVGRVLKQLEESEGINIPSVHKNLNPLLLGNMHMHMHTLIF